MSIAHASARGRAHSIARTSSREGEHVHEHAHTHEHVDEHGHSHTHPIARHTHTHEHHRSLSTILGIIRSAPLSGKVKEACGARVSDAGRSGSRDSFHSSGEGAFSRSRRGRYHRRYCVRRGRRGMARRGSLAGFAAQRWQRHGGLRARHACLFPRPRLWRCLEMRPCTAAGPPMERVTPTGATVLRMLNVEYASLPAMRITATGYGAGGRDTPGQPNLLRVLIGEEVDARATTDLRRAHRHHRDGDRRFHSATARLCERIVAGRRRMGRLSHSSTNEEGPHRRAIDVLVEPRSGSGVARSAVSRDHHDRAALANREQDFAGSASSPRVETQWGPVQMKSRAGPRAKSPTLRRNMRIAANSPRSIRSR